MSKLLTAQGRVLDSLGLFLSLAQLGGHLLHLLVSRRVEILLRLQGRTETSGHARGLRHSAACPQSFSGEPRQTQFRKFRSREPNPTAGEGRCCWGEGFGHVE